MESKEDFSDVMIPYVEFAEKIRQAVEEEDPIDEFGSRFAYHLQLCGIAEFGGSEVFPVEAAERLIADNQERLRQLLDAFMADNPKALGAFLSLR